MNTRLFKFAWIAILVLSISLLAGCKKDDDSDPNTIEDNRVFYDFMQQWYYWNQQMPQINPDTYANMPEVLEALRYQPLDRWSYITDLQSFIDFFQNASFVGYGFGSAWDAQDKLRISFVYNTTDMYSLGVRRSWIIESINGTQINRNTNVNQLLGPNTEGVSNTFVFRKPDGNTESMTVSKKKITMNTVLHYQVIEMENKKVGYMVLQGFTAPTADELNAVFSYFDNQNIDDLILDLRYNGGGATNIALKLAGMIAGPALTGEPFAYYQYNANQATEHNRTDLFATETHSLSLNRLITITTRATASASEMVINGLLPFMDVTLVGANTYGKPMGMNAFTYKEWALVPITFKIANADNYGDYFEGLLADIPATDDLTRMFGDLEETMLQQALAFVISGSTKGVALPEKELRQPRDDMKGLRRIIGAF